MAFEPITGTLGFIEVEVKQLITNLGCPTAYSMDLKVYTKTTHSSQTIGLTSEIW